MTEIHIHRGKNYPISFDMLLKPINLLNAVMIYQRDPWKLYI